MNRAEDIETEIEQTRHEMTDTLQAIERKLSPNRWMDEAMETMRNASLNQSRVMELVRDNPVPVALVGLGIGWLVLSSVRGARMDADDIEDAAEDWSGSGSDLLSGAAEQAGDKVRDLASKAKSKARYVGQKVERTTDTVRRQASDLADSTGDVFRDHPLTVGLLAVAAGVALGAAIPRSRREVEILGDTGADLLDTARETGRDILHKAGRVVQRAGEAVSGEAGSAPTTH
jgi:ElaB/YqjD/DUF883 family membrane-anchored ribosome-binding protein